MIAWLVSNNRPSGNRIEYAEAINEFIPASHISQPYLCSCSITYIPVLYYLVQSAQIVTSISFPFEMNQKSTSHLNYTLKTIYVSLEFSRSKSD